jgi:D-alanyl-lipoteichoic acid acyltransferase DltB (MBOAT superfamily)
VTFSSLPFILLFLLVSAVYAVSADRHRWLILLVASWFFYGCLREPHLLAILAAVTAVSYSCGILINDTDNPARKKLLLNLGVCSNLALLVAFKYLPVLFKDSLVLSRLLPVSSQVLLNSPIVTIGVSYYVFQGISYLVDVYYEMLLPERHFGRFALFMSFFPKLLQGPIERGAGLLPQLQTLTDFTGGSIRIGLNLFLWGLFKKVVVADRIATFIDPIFAHPKDSSPLSLLAAVYLFAFQIYYDFSGYTDMALGIARCFNIRLTQNFNVPYAASSIAEFWRRWHISFSSWILDYIFKPLQMRWRDRKTWGTPLALMVTFLVSGIWHGAGWNYLVWGGLHGV